MSNPDLPESTRLCPNCGASIAAEDVNGLCGACLMPAVARSTLPGSGTPRKSWEPPSAEELGKLLPQYRIERLLGRGGMGAVYQGRQVSLDRVVAIKILSNDLETADASFAERFKNEARAMARMSHPGIVAVHDFGETANGLLYIVMEFIEGTDLAKMIAAQKRLHSEHAMAITAHVCDALAYAHERGIIHRDIKPANIMVGYDGVVKVADFGLAKVSASSGETLGLTQSGMAMGTLHFMAPEALMLGSAVDHRADIYAVGVMLYQMLTGKLPHGMFELPSIRVQGLDPRYDGIIARAMREDRDLRYQSAREMRHDLDGILTQPVQRVEVAAAQSIPAALPTEVRPRRSPAGQPYRPPQHSAPLPVKKKSSAGIVLLTLGLLGVIGSAMFFLGGHRNAPSGVTAPDDSAQAVSTATTTALNSATKDAPFVNSLGMKFVPVPGTNILMCIHETRRQDYAAYAAEVSGIDGRWKNQQRDGIRSGHEDTHPVVGLNWDDAKAFCRWLSIKDGKTYRLPTDREWSYAVGIGRDENWTEDSTPSDFHEKIKDEYPWGHTWPPPAGAGNYADTAWHEKFPSDPWIEGYSDGFVMTSPVMSFSPNKLGIYDLGGNVLEWVEDWWNKEHIDHVQRGNSFRRTPAQNNSLSSSSRLWKSGPREYSSGFRVVVEPLETAAGSASAATPSASPSPSLPISSSSSPTKEAPFTNTLGMKFVPVPGTNILMCIHETRRQDYAAYAAEVQGVDKKWENFTRDGIPVSDKDGHPVVATSWEDAQAFCTWLSRKEGKTYRLPTDKEWSYAVGIGHKEVWTKDTSPKQLSGSVKNEYPWGNQWPPPNGVENYADAAWHDQFASKDFLEGYTDGFLTTAPVMSLKPNKLGIYDLGGNVTEWVEDWLSTDRKDKVLRGGEFGLGAKGNFLSSNRHGLSPAGRVGAVTTALGFRCVAELPEAASGSASAATPSAPPPSPSFPISSSASAATKEAPFTNTLGMKFVPVPITGGPTSGQRVLFSIWETRVQDYEAFVKETGRDWSKPDFEQGPTHPAAGMNRDDAQLFCEWLTVRERRGGKLGSNELYRLPSDHEWSCAVGIGGREDPAQPPGKKGDKIAGVFPWGDAWPPPAGTGNFSGEEIREAVATGRVKLSSALLPLPNYSDGFEATAPVGSFPVSPLGLFDLEGNVFEWCEDKFNQSPKDDGVMRGGCWASGPEERLYLSSHRQIYPRKNRFHFFNGFRVVLAASAENASAPPASASTAPPKVSTSPSLPISSSSTSATKDAPFTNTLGMQFVPVPITGPARSASPSDAGGGPTDGQRVLFSIWETRVQDYEVFVKETSRKWDKTDFEQGPTHPAVNITRDDASAFCSWLSTRERQAGKLDANEECRLPSDHEWSCAVGIGEREIAAQFPVLKDRKTKDIYPWGSSWPPPSGTGNYAGEEMRAAWEAGKPIPMLRGIIPGYRDGFEATAPVGSFSVNAFGLFDVGGNATEWVSDWADSQQKNGVMRGACWIFGAEKGDALLSSSRNYHPPMLGYVGASGFRCVLAPVAASEGRAAAPSAAAGGPSVTHPSSAALAGASDLPSATSPASATKDKPFVNTLGMKFVPVPGTNILMCVHETRRQDYRVYADAFPGTDTTWKSPVVDGKPLMQADDHPVVHVSWEDSMAFCTWLGKKEGHTCRLPSEHEWNLAVAIGVENPRDISPAELQEWITDSYPWPNPALPVSTIRIGDEERERLHQKYKLEHQKAWEEGFKHGNYRGSEDGYEGTAPVMSFLPNHLGIHDLGGNAWEWCATQTTADNGPQPLRGCGFRNFSWYVVSNTRAPLDRRLRIAPEPDGGRRVPGFRCVVELPVP